MCLAERPSLYAIQDAALRARKATSRRLYASVRFGSFCSQLKTNIVFELRIETVCVQTNFNGDVGSLVQSQPGCDFVILPSKQHSLAEGSFSCQTLCCVLTLQFCGTQSRCRFLEALLCML